MFWTVTSVHLCNTAWLLLMMSVNSSYNDVIICMLRNWNLSCIWNDSSVLFLFLPFPFLKLFASCHPILSLLQQPVHLQNPAATGKTLLKHGFRLLPQSSWELHSVGPVAAISCYMGKRLKCWHGGQIQIHPHSAHGDFFLFSGRKVDWQWTTLDTLLFCTKRNLISCNQNVKSLG